MKLIIEINDDIVENMRDEGVCKGDPKKVVRLYQASIADAIANGTPLPKGHGRLIDANDVDNHIIGSVDLRDCPTIVEADESEEEE